MRQRDELVAEAQRLAIYRSEVIDSGDDGLALRMDGLCIIASWGGGWDHVSVSMRDRTPTWDQMQQVRRACFRDDEWVVQYSPPPSAHINIHPNCLHMWRPQAEQMPVPPSWMVGPSGLSTVEVR